MQYPFLAQEYVALALIKAKSEIFHENFITTSELNQFTMLMQSKFNERQLETAIVHNLNPEDFNVKNGIITTTDRCCYDLVMLSCDMLNIMTDESLILNFFMSVEERRMAILENLQTKYSKIQEIGKVLSRVLTKDK